jgi:hypothetical protein
MGNFSRNTFSPLKGYVSVRLQQGVPLVDADWNELSDVTRDETYRSVALTSADGLESKAFDFLAGTPNNPTVMGGTGIVNGRSFQAGPITYDAQPWRNPATAAADGVPMMPPLTTPAANRTDICYVDVWEREVGQAEDPNIVNPAIGVETSVRLRREVALRVAEGTTTLPAEPTGHAHLPLALFNRPAGSNTVLPQHREDLRRVLNMVSLVPAFAPVYAPGATSPSPSWSVVLASGRPYAADLTSPGSALLDGVLPVAFLSGARLREMRVVGAVNYQVGPLFIGVSLMRYGQVIGASPSDTLAQVWATSDPLGMTVFDYTVAMPTDGREIVNNARFSYGLRATSNMGEGGAISGISITYTF